MTEDCLGGWSLCLTTANVHAVMDSTAVLHDPWRASCRGAGAGNYLSAKTACTWKLEWLSASQTPSLSMRNWPSFIRASPAWTRQRFIAERLVMSPLVRSLHACSLPLSEVGATPTLPLAYQSASVWDWVPEGLQLLSMAGTGA